ncbi:MAG: T9SS type A sorting domain-containing protein [Bacteroidia bacterium]|nr:T9SS type A sorting domain-containing protein [Bacteroidia bacterium]
MKKALLLLFASILTGSIQSQTWCAPGSEWLYRVYRLSYLFPQDGFLRVQIDSSYTQAGITYHILNGTYYGTTYPPGSPTKTITEMYRATTYETNGVVYVSRRDYPIFDTLANFNASIGDKWLKSNMYNDCATTSTFGAHLRTVTVIDTGHVVINNISLKKLTLNINPASSVYTITIVEKIGCLEDFLYPYFYCKSDDWNLGTFACFSDNNFPTYKNPKYTLSCDYTTVGKDEFTLEGLEMNVFPNPAAEKVKIEFRGENSPQQVQLIVHDLLGREVLSQYCFSGLEINLTNLKEGLYTLSFVSETKVLARRKLLISE